MPNITDTYINALLADATYALDETVLDGTTGPALSSKLSVRMTPAVADYIGSNFTVGNSRVMFHSSCGIVHFLECPLN